MRSIQEIFDAVIDGGFYPKSELMQSSSYMCVSLDIAKDKKVISCKEMKHAIEEIENYMDSEPNSGLFLSGLLRAINEDSCEKARLAIYRNWVNRPFPKTGEKQ